MASARSSSRTARRICSGSLPAANVASRKNPWARVRWPSRSSSCASSMQRSQRRDGVGWRPSSSKRSADSMNPVFLNTLPQNDDSGVPWPGSGSMAASFCRPAMSPLTVADSTCSHSPPRSVATAGGSGSSRVSRSPRTSRSMNARAATTKGSSLSVQRGGGLIDPRLSVERISCNGARSAKAVVVWYSEPPMSRSSTIAWRNASRSMVLAGSRRSAAMRAR